jgi:hypothetical protein
MGAGDDSDDALVVARAGPVLEAEMDEHRPFLESGHGEIHLRS